MGSGIESSEAHAPSVDEGPRAPFLCRIGGWPGSGTDRPAPAGRHRDHVRAFGFQRPRHERAGAAGAAAADRASSVADDHQQSELPDGADAGLQPVLLPVHAAAQVRGSSNRARRAHASSSSSSSSSAPRAARLPAARARRVHRPGVTQDRTLERNEFQEFIWASTGQLLPLFGHNLFEAPTTFAPVENIAVTPDYAIGPGDELVVRAWGQIEVDYRAVVDRNGMVNIPRVGSVPVAGVRYADITTAHSQRDREDLQEFRAGRDDGPAARRSGVHRRPRAPAGQLHRQLALHTGERRLRRRRAFHARLDARDPTQARQPDSHRTRPLRPAPLRGQVEGRGAAARRRDLHSRRWDRSPRSSAASTTRPSSS